MREIRFIDMFGGQGGVRRGLEEANKTHREYLQEQGRGGADNIPRGDLPNGETEQARGESGDASNTVAQSEERQPQEGGNGSANVGKTQFHDRLNPAPCRVFGGRQGQTVNNDKGRGGNDTVKPDVGQATFHCVWANDNDKWASAIYRYHWNDETLVEADIRAVDADAIPEHDLLCAGFPCQSFSIAGQGGGFADTRGTLFFEICRIAGAKGTPYLLLENVRNLLSVPYTKSIQEWIEADFDEATGEPTAKALKKHKAVPGTKGWVFLKILDSLCELGYGLQWCVLNSKDYGVPQNRERVFIVGHLGGKPRPKVFPIGEAMQAYREPDGERRVVTLAVTTENAHQFGKNVVARQVIDIYNQQLRANQKLAALKGEGVSETSLGTVILHTAYPDEIREYKEISPTISTPAGGGHLPYVASAVLTPDREKKRQHGRRKKEPEEPMFTLTGQDIHGIEIANTLDADGYLRTGARPRDKNGKPQLVPIGRRRYRRLTPTECERLQGFPDGWTEYGLTEDGKLIKISDTQRYKSNGNAVYPYLVGLIGERMFGEDG